jgi:outer membrane lipoprotein carrier protein
VLTSGSVRLHGLLATVVLLCSGPAVAAPAGPSAREVLDRVEKRHRAVSDLSARFVQSYRSGMLGRELKETGTVFLKRPGRMLWQYEQPEKKTFLSDGQRYWFYVPADKQVVVREQAGDKSLATLLLSQTGALSAQFTEKLLASPRPGLQRLELIPRKPDPEVQRVEMDVDADGRIVAIDVHDTQGNRSRFTFDAIRENVGVPDRMFRFDPPAGVEIVTG